MPLSLDQCSNNRDLVLIMATKLYQAAQSPLQGKRQSTRVFTAVTGY